MTTPVTKTIADQITTLLGLPEHQERGLTDAQIAAQLGRPTPSIRRTRRMLEQDGRVMERFNVNNNSRLLYFVATTPVGE